VTIGDRHTMVQTAPIDQAALHGILNQLATLGLRLVSVTSSSGPDRPRVVGP
jgi:hypothetical protein